MNQFIQKKEGELKKTIEFFSKDIIALRTGRANPAVLDGIGVNYYGVKTPINGVANINVTDGRSLVVAPWDKNILKEVEKAVVDADLGFSAVNEGDKIRLTLPQMTEENRKDLVKKLDEKQESTCIIIRQIRDEIKEDIELAKKDKAIAEDDKFKFISELDEEIREINDKIKEMRDKKEEEIMTI